MNVLHHQELAAILFQRMYRGQSVWVDSEAGQRVTLQSVGWEDGRLVAYDHEGNDREIRDYLLADPRREGSDG